MKLKTNLKKKISRSFVFSVLVMLTTMIATSNSPAREIEFPDSEIFDELTENQVEEVLQTLEGNIRIDDLKYLRLAKYSLINGKLGDAKFHLNRVDENRSKLGVIKKHYLAIIAFMENDYAKTLFYLKDVSTYDATKNSIYCLLKIFSAMGLNDAETVKNEMNTCRVATERYTKTDNFWLENLVLLFLKQKTALNNKMLEVSEKNLYDEELSKLWLKTNLYLNREANVIDLLKVLPESTYQSYSARELIAFMYFRTGQYNEAMNFIEDIDSVNSDNIKGNIRILDKAYELAFGHFKLALLKKPDSINALEKGIPVSWIIGQFEDGLSMLTNLSSDALTDKRTKSALEIAFMIRTNQIKLAKDKAQLLRNDFQNRPPLIALMMDTYLALETNDTKRLEDYSEEACKNFDGMSCYIASQTILWKSLGQMTKSAEPPPTANEFNLDEIKNKKVSKKITEEIVIDQRDIEELDSVDAFKNGLQK